MITISRKGIAVAVAVGVIAAGTVTSVGYATGSSANVSACVSKKGQLGLLSKKNKCGKGFKKVAIAKQGPRGAAGARGMTGALGSTGLPGHGAYRLRMSHSDTTVIGSPVTVGSFTYQLGCDHTGGGTSVALDIFAAKGVSGHISGLVTKAYNGGSPATVVYSEDIAPEGYLYTETDTGLTEFQANGLHVVGSDGTVQIVSIGLRSDQTPSPGNDNCEAAGEVVPSN